MKISVHIKICCTFCPVFNLVFPNDKCNIQGQCGKSVKNKKVCRNRRKRKPYPTSKIYKWYFLHIFFWSLFFVLKETSMKIFIYLTTQL